MSLCLFFTVSKRPPRVSSQRESEGGRGGRRMGCTVLYKFEGNDYFKGRNCKCLNSRPVRVGLRNACEHGSPRGGWILFASSPTLFCFLPLFVKFKMVCVSVNKRQRGLSVHQLKEMRILDCSVCYGSRKSHFY